jgi:ribonuclease D
VIVTHADLHEDFFALAMRADRVGWDIETSGLDWSRDRIGTCQIAVGDLVNVVTLSNDETPILLRTLLGSQSTQKVFHHAPFDLRFMISRWNVQARNVACTKVASKILDPHLAPAEHSLKPVLQRHLGVTISKNEQRSDWTAEHLTTAQVKYAADDVSYLVELIRVLESLAFESDRHPLLRASWDYLPHRVCLDIDGAGDVFAY